MLFDTVFGQEKLTSKRSRAADASVGVARIVKTMKKEVELQMLGGMSHIRNKLGPR